MIRMMTTATAADEGHRGPEKVLEGVSGPFQAAHPPIPVPGLGVHLSSQGIHAAIDVPFQGIDIPPQGFRVPVRIPLLPLQLVLALGQAGQLWPPIVLGGSCVFLLKGLVCGFVELFLPEPRLRTGWTGWVIRTPGPERGPGWESRMT